MTNSNIWFNLIIIIIILNQTTNFCFKYINNDIQFIFIEDDEDMNDFDAREESQPVRQ